MPSCADATPLVARVDWTHLLLLANVHDNASGHISQQLGQRLHHRVSQEKSTTLLSSQTFRGTGIGTECRIGDQQPVQRKTPLSSSQSSRGTGISAECRVGDQQPVLHSRKPIIFPLNLAGARWKTPLTSSQSSRGTGTSAGCHIGDQQPVLYGRRLVGVMPSFVGAEDAAIFVAVV